MLSCPATVDHDCRSPFRLARRRVVARGARSRRGPAALPLPMQSACLAAIATTVMAVTVAASHGQPGGLSPGVPVARLRAPRG